MSTHDNIPSSKTRLTHGLAILAACLLAASCSTTRSLREGEYRLAKNEVNITNDKKFNPRSLQSYVKQKPNSSIIFGWNPLLVVYNWAGRDESKGINKFIHKMGTPPVIYDPGQVESSVQNILNHLKYIGYYDSDVRSVVTVDNKKVKVRYDVTLGKRYVIGDISYSVPGGEFEEDFRADSANVTIKPGSFLSEDALEKESARSSAYFRRNGYFGFTKNFYSFEADTLSGSDTCSLEMRIREYTRNETPEDARPFSKYHIGKVSVSYDKDLRFKENVLRNMNTVKPGALYDEKDINNTYSRFSALRLFSGVNLQLTPRDSAIVDCDISLSQSQAQGFKLNLEGSTNSTGLIGISPQLSYYHKNIFRGAQWLNLSFHGNFQFKTSDKNVRSNELGVTASLSFPEFLGLPNTVFKGAQVPRTEINMSYNYQNRPEYTRNIISASYGYSGGIRDKFFYQFYPIRTKIVRLYDLDQDFYDNLYNNPFMRDAYQNHFDAGLSFSTYLTSNSQANPKESFRYGRLQFDLSGNLLSLFNPMMKSDEYGSRLTWGIPYSQYVRAELTFGNTFVFGNNGRQALAMRLLGGFGYAYGNSKSLPFERQFYAGGANSMRGWQARTLGPGMSRRDSVFTIPSQSGDMKLEANIEYRFPLFWKLNGALFTDIGNVWTISGTDTKADNRKSRFDAKKIGESLAANWGVGLRLDLSFLILRLDMGMKVLDPSLEGSHWISPGKWLGKNGFAVHFGVGYPF